MLEGVRNYEGSVEQKKIEEKRSEIARVKKKDISRIPGLKNI